MVNTHQSYIENWNLTVCVKKETSKQTKKTSPVLPACSVLGCTTVLNFTIYSYQNCTTLGTD